LWQKKLNVQKAQAAASDYLVAYMGEKAVPGKPQFDERRKAWSIPPLCQTSRGIFQKTSCYSSQNPAPFYVIIVSLNQHGWRSLATALEETILTTPAW